jgi:hypothetical protein
MDERRGVGGRSPHESERIARVDLHPVVVAAKQADGPPVEDVDRRNGCKLHSSMLPC